MKYKKEALFFSIAFVVIIVDQITKLLVDKYLFGKTITIIRNFLELKVVHNTGAAFGLLKGQLFLLIAVSVIIIFLVIYFLRKTPMKIVPFTALILGGAFGNLIDRIFFGYVVDFINVTIWSVFNVADSCITIGAIGVAVYFFWEEKRKK
ncbi:signal peptidase II [Candidatus Woesearchaeota archaeon]|nr:signal peptidase II [Candidatus Woesearchaeota archaeon]